MNGVELSVIGSTATGRRNIEEEPARDAASSRSLGIDSTWLDCAGGDLGTARLAQDRRTELDSGHNHLCPLDPLRLVPARPLRVDPRPPFHLTAPASPTAPLSQPDASTQKPSSSLFTLFAPRLAQLRSSYPSGAKSSTRSSTPSPPIADGSHSTTDNTAAHFDLSTFSSLSPALEALQKLRDKRGQEDVALGHVGAGEGGTRCTPGGRRSDEGGPGRSSRTGWWLDVMCPSVDDMLDLRKVVPLHPLTIEDILHQETREKVESFNTLGYYFVVFRALGESRSKSSFGAEKVHAVNLYLVVFRDGVLSFHFDPLDQHLTRVRGRLNKLGNSRTFSSDWIAYSLMDSVVDAFFPLVTHIEREATKVDAQLSDPFSTVASRVSRPFALAHRFAAGLATFFSAQLVKTNLAASTLSGDLIGSTRSSRISYLRRLTSLRQLVAGSTRLLAPKVDVVRNLRKRAVDGSPVFRSSSEHEFLFHLDDLLDHIVAMQQTLQFFDAILAHDHPAYIGLLRLSLKLTKTKIDQGIVRLTAVAVVFLPLQLFTTFMGINVRLPYDDDHGPYPGPQLAPFAVCIAVLVGIACATGVVIHLVVLSSRRKYRRRRRANG